ncbi:MAG: Gfo/Idh/MocA family protein [bacterium]
MVGIAMLSFAHVHAEGYARQVMEQPDAKIVAIWDEDEARGREMAKKYNVPFEADLEKVLRMPEVDAVVVDAPTSMHPEVIIASCQAGKHIFTEKALAITTKEADAIVEAVKSSGVKFMISLPNRCRPEILFAKKVIEEKIIGDITFARLRVAHSAALDYWWQPGNWFRDPQRAGGGAFIDLGCHTLDLALWFFGKPKRVSAMLTNFFGNYEVDDNSVALVEFQNKALCVLDVSWVHRSGSNPIELYGTEGSLVINSVNQKIALISRKLAPFGIDGWITPTNLPQPLPSPMRQWLDAITKGSPTFITIEDGRNLTELIEASTISSNEGRVVEFPLKY